MKHLRIIGIALLSLIVVFAAIGCGKNTKSGSPELISINAESTKTSYYIGEKFDPSAGKIKLEYEGGSASEEINMAADGVVIEGFDSTAVGEKTITVTYKEKAAEFKVNVYQSLANLNAALLLIPDFDLKTFKGRPRNFSDANIYNIKNALEIYEGLSSWDKSKVSGEDVVRILSANLIMDYGKLVELFSDSYAFLEEEIPKLDDANDFLVSLTQKINNLEEFKEYALKYRPYMDFYIYSDKCNDIFVSNLIEPMEFELNSALLFTKGLKSGIVKALSLYDNGYLDNFPVSAHYLDINTLNAYKAGIIGYINKLYETKEAFDVFSIKFAVEFSCYWSGFDTCTFWGIYDEFISLYMPNAVNVYNLLEDVLDEYSYINSNYNTDYDYFLDCYDDFIAAYNLLSTANKNLFDSLFGSMRIFMTAEYQRIDNL